MGDEAKKYKEEIEKLRSQFYVFYELTKAMRTTLRLDEIAYIILTGLTSHHGLGFNRAILFLVDEKDKRIKGFMGIGPMDTDEADGVWRSIEQERMDLYDLIKAYHHIKEGKIKHKFMEFVRSLEFPLSTNGNLLSEILIEKEPLHIKTDKVKNFKSCKDLRKDPLIQKFQLEEFLICPLWIKNRAAGIIVVDNYITKKSIDDEEIKIFNMFVEQAQGAIENCQAFEDTLLKAHTDSLTSLWNYGYFQYRLDEELIKVKTNESFLSIMMIDLDEFKKFNDSQGHIRGDEALKKISEVFKDNCRKVDILCRYGGEEFSLILPVTDKNDAYLLAQRIRKGVEKKPILNNKFTVSIGIATYPQDAPDKESLIKKADTALYQAKRQGKNKVVSA